MKWIVVAVTVALAGCPAGDDTVAPDGATGDHGLAIAWQPRPLAIPGPVDGDLTLDRANLHLRDARAIGDAGAGDPRTLAPLVDLIWATGSAPEDLVFDEAPAGLYARMSFQLDRGAATYAYELLGTVDLRGTIEPFTIRDRDPLPVSFEYEVAVAPGARTRLVVRVDLDAVVRAVELDTAPVIGGRRVLETGDAQMTVVRTELAKAFGVHDSDQ